MHPAKVLEFVVPGFARVVEPLALRGVSAASSGATIGVSRAFWPGRVPCTAQASWSQRDQRYLGRAVRAAMEKVELLALRGVSAASSGATIGIGRVSWPGRVACAAQTRWSQRDHRYQGALSDLLTLCF